MEIKNIRPVRQERSAKGFATIARFTFVPIEGVAIFDCTLVAAPDGRHLFYGPLSKSGAQLISLAPEQRHEIIEMTLQQMGIYNNDNNLAA